MTRRTGKEALHTRVVQDKRESARVAATIEHLNEHWCGTLAALAQSEADDWYAAEVERMRERAPA